jgi:hypothetical protein
VSGERPQPNEIYQKLEEEQQKLKANPEMEHYVAKIKIVDGKEQIVVVRKYINGR